jgi:hypothetical protein
MRIIIEKTNSFDRNINKAKDFRISFLHIENLMAVCLNTHSPDGAVCVMSLDKYAFEALKKALFKKVKHEKSRL